MTSPIALIEAAHLKKEIPTFRPGDTVRVHVKIIEGERTRVQPFEGIVVGKRGHGLGATFTVRRTSFGEGVEKVFMVHAPTVERVEVVRQGVKVRRAKLYYLRKSGRRSRELAA